MSQSYFTSTRELAHELGCALSTIQKWCKALGLRKSGRDYLLSNGEVTLIKSKVQEGPGRPRRENGNHFA